MLLAMTGMYLPANAQDTIIGCGPLSNYLPGDFPVFQSGNNISLVPITHSQLDWDDICFPFDAGEDSLPIYGIAAALITSPEYLDSIGLLLFGYYDDVQDTSYTNVIEELRIYRQSESGIEQITDGLPVHIKTTPVSYYMNPNFQPASEWKPFPVYERYFPEPVSVINTFFVGKTCHCAWGTATHYYATWPIKLMAIETSDPNDAAPQYHLYIGENTISYTKNHWYRFPGWQHHFLIFPILTPNPDTNVNPGDTIVLGNDTIAMGDTLIVCDTTIIGGDTIVNYDTILSIIQTDLLQRFTGVIPNPAAEMARVVSSFGMSMVKVYNASGALVHTQRADGLYVDLDVSRWPAGTYLVRIHTPQGIATKRLVVSR